MKYGLYVLVFHCCLLLGSCADSDKTGVQHQANGVKGEPFRVVVGAIAGQDDEFSLFYTTDGSIDFTKIPPISTRVKGSSKLQEVAFTLPKNIRPTQLRIDLGRNVQQKDLFVKWIRLSYSDKSVTIPGTFVFSYFRTDLSSTRSDASTGRITAVVKDGVRLVPSLYPKEEPLSEKLEYLYE